MKRYFLTVAIAILTAAILLVSCGKKVEDKCSNVICYNGGTCIDGTCECPVGYEGNDCAKLTAAKFIALWKGDYTSVDIGNNYTNKGEEHFRIESTTDDKVLRLTSITNNTYFYLENVVCEITGPNTFKIRENQEHIYTYSEWERTIRVIKEGSATLDDLGIKLIVKMKIRTTYQRWDQPDSVTEYDFTIELDKQ